MLSVGNTALGSGSSLSLDVRAAAGAAVLAANTNASSASTGATDAVTLSSAEQSTPAVPVYNAYEFIYRSDYGKIILREQNVDTGQEVTQIPSEYHLQQYAATQRAQRVQQQAKLYHLENGGTQPRQGTGVKATGSTGKTVAAAASTGQSAPAPAPTPAPQAAAPAAPAVAAAAAPAAHIDIKV